MIEIPSTLREARTVASETAWLDALPDLVGEIASRWTLEIGRSLEAFGGERARRRGDDGLGTSS